MKIINFNKMVDGNKPLNYIKSEIKKYFTEDTISLTTNGSIASALQVDNDYRIKENNTLNIPNCYSLGLYLDKILIVDKNMKWDKNIILLEDKNNDTIEIQIIDDNEVFL